MLMLKDRVRLNRASRLEWALLKNGPFLVSCDAAAIGVFALSCHDYFFHCSQLQPGCHLQLVLDLSLNLARLVVLVDFLVVESVIEFDHSTLWPLLH